MSLTRWLYRALRVSRDVNAVRRGPKAATKRAARKAAYRGFAKLVSRVIR
jgi:hypothetical protein